MNHRQGILDYPKALQQLRSANESGEQTLEAAASLILGQHYDDFPEVIRALQSLKLAYENHPVWNYCLGFAKSTQQDADAAIHHLLKAIGHIYSPSIFHALTWSYLQKECFSEAFLSSSAGLGHYPKDIHLKGLYDISKHFCTGSRKKQFTHEDTEYEFALFTSNSQETEAAITHLYEKLTEADELRMLKEQLGEVDAIAEIGCLVGNHSAFFLKELKPHTLTIIDASSTSIEHASINIDLNRNPERKTRVTAIHSAVGKEEGTLSFFNETVPVNPLNKLLTEPYDFIKIDVDGMEIEALEGATDYLKTHGSKVMIEVLHNLKEPFDRFLSQIGYRIIAQHDRPHYTNYLIGPAAQFVSC